MGGRGASSGIADNGKRYGEEYKTIAQFGNVKVVKQKDEKASVTAPMETAREGRVYATLDKDNNIKHITMYDPEGERMIQIDVKGHKHNGMEVHTHMGYVHDEFGTRAPNEKEAQLVDKILNRWERKRKKLQM